MHFRNGSTRPKLAEVSGKGLLLQRVLISPLSPVFDWQDKHGLLDLEIAAVSLFWVGRPPCRACGKSRAALGCWQILLYRLHALRALDCAGCAGGMGHPPLGFLIAALLVDIGDVVKQFARYRLRDGRVPLRVCVRRKKQYGELERPHRNNRVEFENKGLERWDEQVNTRSTKVASGLPASKADSRCQPRLGSSS